MFDILACKKNSKNSWLVNYFSVIWSRDESDNSWGSTDVDLLIFPKKQKVNKHIS